jgi:hypothetical protein
MEFVMVSYPPPKRSVYIDGVLAGSTNEVLQLETGTHVFDLGEPADYDPPTKKLLVEGTTVLSPMPVAFTKKAGQP